MEAMGFLGQEVLLYARPQTQKAYDLNPLSHIAAWERGWTPSVLFNCGCPLKSPGELFKHTDAQATTVVI